MNSIVLLLVLTATGAEPPIDAGQFARLVHGLQSDYRDVSMVFEGGDRPVGGSLKLPHAADLVVNFQGHYALRADGATLLDVYHRFHKQNRDFYSHDIMASIAGETKIANASPDVRRFNHAANKASEGQYDRPASLRQILFLSYFREIDNLAERGFEDQGWEEIDGHRCLRAQIDYYPGAKGAPDRHFQRFWIDMARGGHPLKVEAYWGPDHVSTIHGVQLAEFPTATGKKLWLPVAARVDSYLGSGAHVELSPTMNSTYLVVNNSVRINDGLKDDVFRVDRKGGLPETPEIKRLRDMFESAPLPRSDAAGVKAHLDRALTEADSQSERLLASSPARTSWSGTNTAQVGLAVVGVGLLGGIGYRRWRGR